MTAVRHDLVTAGNMRWCLGCALFQSRRGPGASWYPPGREEQPCPGNVAETSAQTATFAGNTEK